jgi:hypothetical protein
LQCSTDGREDGSIPFSCFPPLADDKPPLIRSLALSRGGTTYILGAASKLPQGTYVISADVVDPADSSWLVGPFAPYSIRLAVDGVEISRKVFDVARGAKGDLVFFSNGGGVMSELRSPEGRWILAERQFTRGRVSLELRVEDAAGNKRSSTWTISIE